MSGKDQSLQRATSVAAPYQVVAFAFIGIGIFTIFSVIVTVCGLRYRRVLQNAAIQALPSNLAAQS